MSLLRWCVPLALATALASPHAATPGAADALRAADPDTPTPATPSATTPALPAPQRLDTPSLPADLQRAREIWRQANERVADFPRGHIDLLRWEQKQPAAAAPNAPAAPAMGLGDALRESLRARPDLFTHAGMNALEHAEVGVAYARHRRDLQLAWIDAIALRQRARLAQDVLDAARTGTELGRRMVVAGNWPQARLMQEQRIEADAWQAAANASAAAHGAIERLARLLGRWRAADVDALARALPAALPALPEQPSPGTGLREDTIEGAVLRSHPALAIERATARQVIEALPEARWAAAEAATDAALRQLADPVNGASTPPHLQDRSLLRDERLQEALEHRAALLRLATERRSMARQAWAQVRASHASARHAEAVVTELQTALLQESQLRYNGMLESTWQLLASARARIGALNAALMARREHWRAQASWQALLAGADFTPDTTGAPAPAGASGNEGGH